MTVRRRLSLSDIAAVTLVAGTLAVTAVRLASDDTIQMANRVVEMSRSEPVEQLVRSVALQR